MIKRHLEDYLVAISKKYPVVSVTGPRQSGKTTLIKKAFPEYHYISLENPDNRMFALSDPNGFLAQFNNEGFILDEVQRVPELFSYIQTYVDDSGELGNVILSGSQNFLLSDQISQSLSGRVKILRLLPFSYDEIKGKIDVGSLNNLLFSGLYPVIYDRNLKPHEWYPDYIETYLERDVRNIKNISDLTTFQRFIALCAGRIGQLINTSAIANECGVSHNTVKSWLSVLESSYIIKLLPPYYKNFNKRVVKQKKLYFYDTGLAAYLLGIASAEQLSTHYLRGGFFENFIIMEILKGFWNAGNNKEMFFWQDNNKNEVDLIIPDSEKFTAVEIKSGSTVKDDFFKGLKYWQRLIEEPFDNLFLVYAGEKNYKYKFGNVRAWNNLTDILAAFARKFN